MFVIWFVLVCGGGFFFGVGFFRNHLLGLFLVWFVGVLVYILLCF